MLDVWFGRGSRHALRKPRIACSLLTLFNDFIQNAFMRGRGVHGKYGEDWLGGVGSGMSYWWICPLKWGTLFTTQLWEHTTKYIAHCSSLASGIAKHVINHTCGNAFDTRAKFA